MFAAPVRVRHGGSKKKQNKGGRIDNAYYEKSIDFPAGDSFRGCPAGWWSGICQYH